MAGPELRRGRRANCPREADSSFVQRLQRTEEREKTGFRRTKTIPPSLISLYAKHNLGDRRGNFYLRFRILKGLKSGEDYHVTLTFSTSIVVCLWPMG